MNWTGRLRLSCWALPRDQQGERGRAGGDHPGHADVDTVGRVAGRWLLLATAAWQERSAS
jgi:hypothetical protein